MNTIILNGNKVEVCKNRIDVLSNPDMKILEECEDSKLKDKLAYWDKIINPTHDPTCHLRYEKNGIKVYDYDYE